MIKQLQLRGISRSPSDRATPDGGCAESLNIHLEEGESAPTLPAEDLADKLQWEYPDEGEYLYIHKGQGYEKYIYIADSSVKAISVGGESETLFSLNEGENVVDVSHVGNTLVIMTNMRSEYVLHKNGEYFDLGDRIPKPVVRFESVRYDLLTETGHSIQHNYVLIKPYYQKEIYHQYTYKVPLGPGRTPRDTDVHYLKRWGTIAWRNYLNGSIDKNDEVVSDYAEIKDSIWEIISAQTRRLINSGYMVAPVFARYALRLYSGDYIYQSVPILLCSAGQKEFMTARGYVKLGSATPGENTKCDSFVEAWLNSAYKVKAYLESYDAAGWEDIIESIDIFLSTDIHYPTLDAEIRSVTFNSDESSGVNEYYDISFESEDQEKNDETLLEEILSKSNFYRIATFKLNGVSRLTNGYDMTAWTDMLKYTYTGLQEYLVEQQELPDDYRSHHRSISEGLNLYNNRIILSGISSEITSGYEFLNGLCTTPILESYYKTNFKYRIKFYINDGGKTLKVIGRNKDGEKWFEPYHFDKYDSASGWETIFAKPYSWIAYPDSRCTLMAIERVALDGTVIARCKYTMHAHPRLNCSYAFIGMNEEFAFQTNTQIPETNWVYEDRWYKEDDLIWASEANNPFLFTAGGIIRFNSDVIGLAAITAPLSEGQAGQFDMYVFTENGIYALKNNAEGDFILSHLISREVAINKNILGFEQTVIFVSDKGVMMLQGSQITNLSPEMTGRHYTLETDVASILSEDTDWSGLISAVSDNTPFMAFMRDAKIAYDYKGGRLIFFNDAKAYQYVYMFGTQSWHKLLGGSGGYTVLNSYPDCIVAKYTDRIDTEHKLVTIRVIGESETHELSSNDVRLMVENMLPGMDSGTDLSRLPMSFVWSNADAHDFTEAIESADYQIDDHAVYYTVADIRITDTALLDHSTVLDNADVLSDEANPVKGIIITRPFDLGEPDIRKAIKSIRIRGKYDRGNVKYILCGSMDGIHWKRLTSFRGGSCNLYRLVILANLSPTERITLVDVDYETRFADKLR